MIKKKSIIFFMALISIFLMLYGVGIVNAADNTLHIGNAYTSMKDLGIYGTNNSQKAQQVDNIASQIPVTFGLKFESEGELDPNNPSTFLIDQTYKSICLELPMSDTEQKTWNESFSVTYRNAAYNGTNRKFNVRITVSNIQVNDFDFDGGVATNTNKKYLKLFRYGNGGLGYPAMIMRVCTNINDSNTNYGLNEETAAIIKGSVCCDVKMQIIDPLTNDVVPDGTFVFAMKDIDRPTTQATNDAKRYYGDGSEGIRMMTGFHLDTMRITPNSTLYGRFVEGQLRVTGSDIVDGNAEYDAGFSIIADAANTTFKWRCGWTCETYFCDFGQPLPAQMTDNTPPTVSISPEKSLTNGDTIKVSITTSDDIGLKFIWLVAQDSTNSNGKVYTKNVVNGTSDTWDATVTFNDIGGSDGTYKFIAFVWDTSFNNTTSAIAEVVLDRTPPDHGNWIDGTPRYANVASGGTFRVHTQGATDNLSGVNNLTVYATNVGNSWNVLNGTGMIEWDNNGTKAWYYDVPVTVEGTYTIEAIPYDKAGNVKWSGPQEVMVIDRTNPTVTPTNITCGSDETITLTDTLSGIRYFAVTTSTSVPSSSGSTDVTTGSTLNYWYQVARSTTATNVKFTGLGVGTYYAWGKDMAGNYAYTQFTVSKGSLTITAKDQTIEYGSSIAQGTDQIISTGLSSGHTVTGIILTASRSTVGSGFITPTGATIKDANGTIVNNNYDINYSDGALTINKKAVTKPSLSGTYTYNTQEQEVTINNFSSSLMTKSGYKGTNAGNYTVTFSLKDKNNYYWNGTNNSSTDLQLSWTINQYDLANASIASISNEVYNGNEHKPKPIATVPIPSGSTTTLVENTHFTYSYSNNIDAGTATVKINAIANTNYKGSKSATFIIEKIANPIEVSGRNLTYNGSPQTLVVVSNNQGTVYYVVRNTPQLTSTSGGSASVPTRTDAGTYTIQWYVTGNTNYYSAYGTVSTTIARYDISTNTNATVGNIPDYNYDYGNEIKPEPDVTVTIKSGKLIKGTEVKYSYEYNTQVNIPTEIPTVTIEGVGNYIGTQKKTFNIIQIANPIQVTANNLTYNADNQYLINVANNKGGEIYFALGSTQLTSTNYKSNGDNADSGGPKGKDAGNYTVQWYAEGSRNFYLTEKRKTDVTIKPYNLSNAMIEDIPDYTYTGNQIIPTSKPTVMVPIPVGTTTTLIENTDFTYSYGRNLTVPEGGSVSITAVNGSNYTGSKAKNFRIAERVLNIPELVGEYYYNGNEQEANFDNRFDDNTMQLYNNKQTNAGLYTVTVSIKDPANNKWSDDTKADKTYNWRINKILPQLTLNPNSAITIVKGNKTNIAYTSVGEATVKASSRNTSIAIVDYGGGIAKITGTGVGSVDIKFDMEETMNYLSLQKEITVNVLEAYYSITKNGQTVYYNKLQDAIDDASNGNTIVVLKDAPEQAAITLNKSVTLDLQNYKITNNNAITIPSGTTVTIIGKTSAGKSGGIETTSSVAIINNGTLTLDKSAGNGIIQAPVIKGTDWSINSSNGTFNFYDGKLIGKNYLPYTGNPIHKPTTYIYTSKNGNMFESILKIDTTPPVITGEKPNRTLINVGQEVSMAVNITEKDSGIEPNDFTADDIDFYVGGVKVTPSKVNLTYSYEYDGVYRYQLDFMGITGNGKLVIKVEKDKVFDRASLGNLETIISDEEITVDNKSPRLLEVEIELVNPKNGETDDGDYEVDVVGADDENGIEKYEWEMMEPGEDEWRVVETNPSNGEPSKLIGTVTVEGEYKVRLKVTDNAGNKVYSNVVKFIFKPKTNFNAKPTITFEKEVISSNEVKIHAIIKSTTKLVSVKVNREDYSSHIAQGETVEGKWQIRTEIIYSARVNTTYKFEVTDSQGNTVTEVYNVSDISREEADVKYKIVDATAFETAKIIFEAQEDVLLEGIKVGDRLILPSNFESVGFKVDSDSTTYTRTITVFVTSETNEINSKFIFTNNIGNTTEVEVKDDIESVYRNLRTVLNASKKLVGATGVYTNGITLNRAENLVIRMKNANATSNSIGKSYYGIDTSKINLRVTTDKDISAVKVLGGAGLIQVKVNSDTISELSPRTEILSSFERSGQTGSANNNMTGVYFSDDELLEKDREKQNSFHVTITNK